jgi:putative ABC transport system permease protein
VALVVGDDLSRGEEDQLRDAVALLDAGTSIWVERGFQDGAGVALLLLVLGAGTLVLAGTFAATSLALVEAQPDFVVLGQVGARPRTRRTVAGAYAAVLALAGAVLGVLAGAVPGLTAALALTRNGYAVSGPPGEPLPSAWTYVDVPELLLVGLLVALPALAGALAALTVRSTPAAAAVRRLT